MSLFCFRLALFNVLLALSWCQYLFKSGHSPPSGHVWDSCVLVNGQYRFFCSDDTGSVPCDFACDYSTDCPDNSDEINCPS